MSKGLIPVLVSMIVLALPLADLSAAEIYKVVDKDGNVTFTDQKPAEGAQPVDLPPLSVVETDIDVPEKPATAEAAEAEEAKPPTLRDLRREFSDFRIIQPANEETFWGTANTVTVSWGSSKPVPEGMNVTLFVNGKGQKVPASGSISLILDRGEHKVYAELRDSANRSIVKTETVIFFVKQHSANFGGTVLGNGN